ncbi:MAG: type II toxin-antitoxin system PemK/MazF family toxin [Ignavibacteriota bacterium]
MIDPQRGEIWLLEFDPVRGAEIGKTRPAIVISVPTVGKLPLRMIVPVTDWKEYFSDLRWMTEIDPTTENGLSKTSGADAFQCKSFSLERFKRKLGKVSGKNLDEIAASIALCIGFEA